MGVSYNRLWKMIIDKNMKLTLRTIQRKIYEYCISSDF